MDQNGFFLTGSGDTSPKGCSLGGLPAIEVSLNLEHLQPFGPPGRRKIAPWGEPALDWPLGFVSPQPRPQVPPPRRPIFKLDRSRSKKPQSGDHRNSSAIRCHSLAIK